MSTCQISTRHCELCGNTDPEDINTGADPDLQGYSACCNEPVVDPGDCGNHGADDGRPVPPISGRYVDLRSYAIALTEYARKDGRNVTSAEVTAAWVAADDAGLAS